MTEHRHQAALFQWSEAVRAKYPELALLYAVPNAARRSPRQGKWMKDEGMRAGVPDIVLPVPRGIHSALYIELKVPASPGKRKGQLSPAQRWWRDALRKAGNRHEVAYGWDEAREVIEMYLNQERS